MSVALATLLTPAAGKAETQQAEATPPGLSPAMGRPAEERLGATGKVVETMNSGGYTYVQVDAGNKTIWAAAPQFDVKVGDSVVVPDGMPMRNYHSKTLDRTFDVVYFVAFVAVMDPSRATDTLPRGHPRGSKEDEPVEVELSEIEEAPGGKTVAELFEEKARLAGEEVVVRGKVVKFTPGIMGKNWLHLRDGTGVDGSNDLTVTTEASAKVGDTVLVRGAVTVDKNFGFGYRYSLLIEDAQVTIE
jgi:hypothetical protein